MESLRSEGVGRLREHRQLCPTLPMEVIQEQTLNRPKGCTKHRLGYLIMSSCLLEARI